MLTLEFSRLVFLCSYSKFHISISCPLQISQNKKNYNNYHNCKKHFKNISSFICCSLEVNLTLKKKRLEFSLQKNTKG